MMSEDMQMFNPSPRHPEIPKSGACELLHHVHETRRAAETSEVQGTAHQVGRQQNKKHQETTWFK